MTASGSGGPPKRIDPRRDYDDDEDVDDCPTDDVTVHLPPVRPKLRLGVPVVHDSFGSIEEETERIPTSELFARGARTAALPRELRAWIEIAADAGESEPYEMTMVRLTIGRGQQADVRIADRALSRLHTTIFYNGSEFRIRDEKTKNGTILNGSPVVEYVLRDGDEVTVGRITFVFHVESRDIPPDR